MSNNLAFNEKFKKTSSDSYAIKKKQNNCYLIASVTCCSYPSVESLALSRDSSVALTYSFTYTNPLDAEADEKRVLIRMVTYRLSL